MSKAFISYSTKDREVVLSVVKRLRSAGIDLWIGDLDIPGGCLWDDEIEQALKECTRMLVFLSPSSVASKNVRDEIEWAIGHKMQLIPVLLQPCEAPLQILRFQRVDLTGPREQGIESLLRHLQGANLPERRYSATGPNNVVEKWRTERRPFLAFFALTVVGIGGLLYAVQRQPQAITTGLPPSPATSASAPSVPHTVVVAEPASVKSSSAAATERDAATFQPNAVHSPPATEAPIGKKKIAATATPESKIPIDRQPLRDPRHTVEANQNALGEPVEQPDKQPRSTPPEAQNPASSAGPRSARSVQSESVENAPNYVNKEGQVFDDINRKLRGTEATK